VESYPLHRSAQRAVPLIDGGLLALYDSKWPSAANVNVQEESNQGAAREHEANELELLTDEQIVFARRPLSKTATFSKGRLASGKTPDKGAAGRYFLPSLSQGVERGSFSVLPVLFLDRSLTVPVQSPFFVRSQSCNAAHSQESVYVSR
jgi:hypothetical protein